MKKPIKKKYHSKDLNIAYNTGYEQGKKEKTNSDLFEFKKIQLNQMAELIQKVKAEERKRILKIIDNWDNMVLDEAFKLYEKSKRKERLIVYAIKILKQKIKEKK